MGAPRIGIGTHARAARQDMLIPLVKTITSPVSTAIGSAPMRLVKQRPSVTT
jgi:hypothetical protein